MRRARYPTLAALAAVLFPAACTESEFRLHVTFPAGLAIEEGAPVRYRGVEIGRVESVSLLQTSPSQPAQLQLTLAIAAGDVILREADRIHVSSAGGTAEFVRISPSGRPSPPLESGASVAGVPPMVTHFEESIQGAVGALAGEVAETARLALADLGRSLAGVPPEVVVLLRGPSPSDGSLDALVTRLAEAGFRVHEVDYASIPDESAERRDRVDLLAREITACCAAAPQLHFVTDARGATLVSAYLAEHELPNLGRTVMLTPPGASFRDLPGELPRDAELEIIASSDEAAEQTIHFLENGRFGERVD